MQIIHTLLRRAAVVLSLALLASCGGTDDTPPPFYNVTTVVGASLSDSGNTCLAAPSACPPAPPYATGKFSNGALWVELLAANYGGSAKPSLVKDGTNFSFAGARTGSVRAALDAAGLFDVLLSDAAGTNPTVPAISAPLGSTPSQVDQLLNAFKSRIHPLTLVVVDASTFGNNIVDALTLGAQYPADAANISNAIVMGAVADIVDAVTRLQAAGAKTILIVNTPNVGATPKAQALGPAAIAGATQLATAFNTALAQQITLLRNAKPSTAFLLFDLYALEAQIKSGTAPGGFTLTNVTDACVVTAPVFSVCGAPNTYFYWDSFHPTAALGAYLAQRSIALVQSVTPPHKR